MNVSGLPDRMRETPKIHDWLSPGRPNNLTVPPKHNAGNIIKIIKKPPLFPSALGKQLPNCLLAFTNNADVHGWVQAFRQVAYVVTADNDSQSPIIGDLG